MSDHHARKGPEHLSAWADRANANSLDIEARVLRELAAEWQEDERALEEARREASLAPNVGVTELEQLRTDAAAFRALAPLRQRAAALLGPFRDKDKHWVEDVVDLLQESLTDRTEDHHAELPDFTPEQEEEVLDRTVKSYNQVHHGAPLTREKVVAVVSLLELAKGALRHEQSLAALGLAPNGAPLPLRRVA